MQNGTNGNGHLLNGSHSSPSELSWRDAVPEGAQCEHILVPVTLSARERPAVLMGLNLGRAHHAKVTFLRVLPPEEPPHSIHWLDAIDRLHQGLARWNGSIWREDGHSSIESLRTEIDQWLQEEIPPAARTGVEIRTEVGFGDAAHEIARYADTADVDLVILCSAPSSWGLPILPAHVRRILQLTKKQVVLVRPDPQKAAGSLLGGR